MKRPEMLKVVHELLEVLNEKKISPQDADSIAEIFSMSVKNSNKAGMAKYMEVGVFSGSPPRN